MTTEFKDFVRAQLLAQVDRIAAEVEQAITVPDPDSPDLRWELGQVHVRCALRDLFNPPDGDVHKALWQVRNANFKSWCEIVERLRQRVNLAEDTLAAITQAVERRSK